MKKTSVAERQTQMLLLNFYSNNKTCFSSTL